MKEPSGVSSAMWKVWGTPSLSAALVRPYSFVNVLPKVGLQVPKHVGGTSQNIG